VNLLAVTRHGQSPAEPLPPDELARTRRNAAHLLQLAPTILMSN
jgi:hypothetical protein